MRPGGAFRDYVREVFAQALRWRRVRTRRTHFLHGVIQRPMPRAVQRWEGEGGSTR